MRKCEYKLYERSSEGKSTKVVRTGTFHQWASGFMEFNEGPVGNYTYALVEAEDGQMFEVFPTEIKFLEPVK